MKLCVFTWRSRLATAEVRPKTGLGASRPSKTVGLADALVASSRLKVIERTVEAGWGMPVLSRVQADFCLQRPTVADGSGPVRIPLRNGRSLHHAGLDGRKPKYWGVMVSPWESRPRQKPSPVPHLAARVPELHPAAPYRNCTRRLPYRSCTRRLPYRSCTRRLPCRSCWLPHWPSPRPTPRSRFGPCPTGPGPSGPVREPTPPAPPGRRDGWRRTWPPSCRWSVASP